jgi:RNA polymerase sigma-70 factor (ECF subfamily)
VTNRVEGLVGNGVKEQRQYNRGDEFMRLYLACEYRIRGYIRCLVKHYADVDDVLQNAVVVMWEKYRSFESREHFLRWALNITRLEVLKHFEKKRNRLQKLSPKVFSTIEEKAAEIAQKEDRRWEALQECIESLREQDKELLRLRYQIHSTTRSVAQTLGRSSASKWIRLEPAMYKCLRAWPP